MTAAIETAPAVGAAVLLALAAILAGLLIWASTGSDAPTWAPGELAATAVVEPAGPGRHRVVADRAHEAVATWTRYQSRHSFAEVPPSVAGLAALMPVGLRATIVARAVNPRWWPKPHTSRVALEAWGRVVARRHGIVCQLGRYQIAGVLP